MGFSLLLKLFEREGRFPRHGSEMPRAAVDYVARQVKVDPALFGEYRWSGSTIEYHRAQVREALGFRESTRADEDVLAAWLADKICPKVLTDEGLRSALLARCRTLKIEPPGRMDRIAGAGCAGLVANTEVAARWGIIDLLDFLKESDFVIDFVTDFTDAFTTVSTREATPREVIRKRLLLVLYALGTNVGIKRVADGGRHGETEAALRATRHLFVNRDNLRNAIATLVNATLKMRGPLWWGNGTACASDSKKFGSWSSDLMTEYHAR